MSWWPPWKSKPRPVISSKELKKILRKEITWSFIYEPYLADKNYFIPTESEVYKRLRAFNPGIYSQPANDCDNIAYNFAHSFPGESVGTIYIKQGKVNHVLNFYVNKERELVMFDASSKEVFRDLSKVKAFRCSCI